jgi:7,8-dihydropterin-6-yl-methyl-4-(beta-D-ribofuranosyl)aminobenzene 5'-phosphate synthase
MSQEDSRAACETAGARFVWTKDPVVITPGMVTSGEVPRKTEFENVGIALKTIRDGGVKQDTVLDDVSLIARVQGKGIVILTGCSHAGIVNILRYAMEITGDKHVEGIIGGIHLVDAAEDVIQKTTKALAEINPSWISVGHCTGFRAQAELFKAFGKRLSPLQTGMRFEISA